MRGQLLILTFGLAILFHGAISSRAQTRNSTTERHYRRKITRTKSVVPTPSSPLPSVGSLTKTQIDKLAKDMGVAAFKEFSASSSSSEESSQSNVPISKLSSPSSSSKSSKSSSAGSSNESYFSTRRQRATATHNRNQELVDNVEVTSSSGEYQTYHGVMGKPGRDFPVLTHIPKTKFTCRRKKSGYYADLDTDCQVFHICDNGRKISFLCPNGTVFRQHDQICDWWFKVECLTNSGGDVSSSGDFVATSSRQQHTDPIKRIITEKSLVFNNPRFPPVQSQIQNDSPEYSSVNLTNSDELVSYEASTYQKQSYERQHSQNQFQLNRQRLNVTNSTSHSKNSHQQTQFIPTATPSKQIREEQIFVATENPIKNIPRGFRKTVRRQKVTKTTTSSTTPATIINESQIPAESASFTSSSNKRFYQQKNNLDHSGNRRPQQYNTDFTRSNVFDGTQQTGSRSTTSTLSPNYNQKYNRRPNGRYSSKVRQNVTISSTSPPLSKTKDFDENSYRFNESFAPFTPSSVLTTSTTTTTKPPYGFFLTFTFPTTTTTTTTPKPTVSSTKDCGTKNHNNTKTSSHSENIEASTASPITTFLTPKIDSLYSRVTKSYGEVQTTEITPHAYRDAKQLTDQQSPQLNMTLDVPYYYPIPGNYSDPTIYSPEDDSVPPFFTTTEKPRYSTSATKYSPTVPTVTPKPSSGRAYSPSTPLPTPDPSENAIRMLHTLDDLSGGRNEEAEEDLKYFGEPRPGLKIPPSSSPDTLHSLAVYFASVPPEEETKVDIVENNSIHSALLTRMTLDNYNQLFTSDNSDDLKSEDDTSLEIQSKIEKEIDLNLQESQGPVDRQSNKNPKNNTVSIRKLARVFTHALSEYLKDPETFRRVLTEVRPKEPNTLVESEYNDIKAPLYSPTTTEPTTTTIFTDHPSITKEEDEVLEYSDVIKTTSRARFYSPTVPTTESTTTTETPITSPPTTISFLNSLAVQLNNEINAINSNTYEGSSAENNSSSLDDDYFPINYHEQNNKTTPTPYGLHVKPNDSVPLGLNDLLTTTELPATTTTTHVKTYFIPEDLNKLAIVRVNENPHDHLLQTKTNQITNDEKLQGAFSQSFVKDRLSKQNGEFKIVVTTEIPTTSTTESSLTESTTTNRPTTTTDFITSTTTDLPSTTTIGSTTTDYSTTQTSTSPTNESKTISSTTESSTLIAVPSTTLVPPYRDNTISHRQIPQNHWTNSVEISRFLQASVTLDPEIINQELTGDSSTTSISSAEQSTTNSITSTHVYETSTIVTSDLPTQTTTTESQETFTLAETNKAVSPPTRAAKSYQNNNQNITSTNNQIDDVKITSQQIIYNLPLVPENIQMQSAKIIFGDLNSTSQDIIMEKMKHADKNKSVRKLVLLLINTCDLNHNRTLEHARKAILDALINIPLDEDDILLNSYGQNTNENIDDLNSSSSGRNIPSPQNSLTTSTTTSTSTTSTTALPLLGTTNKYHEVTTYRNTEFISRHNRKFDSDNSYNPGDLFTTEHNFSIDLLPEFENNSDKRALELLKSLYSLASRWSRK